MTGPTKVPRVHVAFPINGCADGECENMHAVPLGGATYILDNSPFYVYGISYCDTFEAVQRDGRLVFLRVLERGGHSTYRVKLPVGADHGYFLLHWRVLETLGCTYEGSASGEARLYSIDMAPSVDVAAAYAWMDAKQHDSVWFFEEGHYYKPEHGSAVLTN
ncbi:MAG TPA: DUF4265 domain-containing protein [Woeseiaceae bacterium]|nr:DUF4265 domain-containing protein [Woeseiaceae bacterium]